MVSGQCHSRPGRPQESTRTGEQVEAQGAESDPGKQGTSQASPRRLQGEAGQAGISDGANFVGLS